MLLPASMDFLSRSDAESLRLAIAAVPPPLGRVTQDGLVAVAENQIHGPQSMSGAFWGSRTALWSDSIPQPNAGWRGLFGNILIYNMKLSLITLPQVAGLELNQVMRRRAGPGARAGQRRYLVRAAAAAGGMDDARSSGPPGAGLWRNSLKMEAKEPKEMG
jgi:hypothetical protein